MFINIVPLPAAPTGPIHELASGGPIQPASDELAPSSRPISVQTSAGRQASSASAQVSVVAPAAPIQVGEVFIVTVATAQVDTPLSAFQFDLSYDPLLLDLLDAAEGSFLSATGRAAVCPTPAQGEGMVRLACASTGPMGGPTGDGTLAVLTFRGRDVGGSDLVLSNAQLPDDGRPPTLLSATLQNGHVNVGGSQGHRIYLPVIMKPYAALPPVEKWATPRVTSSLASWGTATRRAFPGLSRAVQAQLSDYWADIDGDQDVDIVDLQVVAGFWNCTAGQSCYDATYDWDADDDIDVLDLATVGNEYDVEGPEVVIAAPPEGAAVSETSVLVSGTVSDTHTVTSVTVNDVAATLTNDQFEASVALASGNQVIAVVAEDEVGAVGMASRIVAVDTEGPMIEVIAPPNRQSVYTTMPAIEIHYSDFYAAVDTSTLSVVLEAAGGGPVDVTSDLTVESDRAYGSVSTSLQEDTSYTMTVSLQDTFANETVAQATFYVPLDPGSITPPDEPADAGWVSGVIYDSSTCDEHLTWCQGLAGARVTLERVDEAALQSVRAARQRQIEARLATKSQFTPLSPAAVNVTTAISGTIVTGPDGFFAFPLAETGHYWLRVEKGGYSYGQREAEVVKECSAATNAIYLTPLDPAETACDEGGCSHTSSDGMVEVEIPPNAIPAGEVVTTTATNFEHVEFLPSGELPPGTQETYAFNLGGDSQYEFQEPVAVRIQNHLGFNPGTKVPVGYWNDATQAWEHAGTGVVDANGQWIEMEVRHFSNYDCNDPVTKGGGGGRGGNGDGDGDGDGCLEDEEACSIILKSGALREDITLPSVSILGQDVAPVLLYNSIRANPSKVIDVNLSVNPDPSVEISDYIGFELYIEGQKTDGFFISNTVKSGEVGRYRYLWDGRDAQGNLLPPGVYEYRVKFSIPYRAQYCYALGGIFGNPPDCEFGATGVFVDTTDDVWVEGTVELNTQVNSPLGTGWVLDGVQRLYEDEAGRILITDGENMTEFYAAGKDLLTEYYSSGGGTVAATLEGRGLSSIEDEVPGEDLLALLETPWSGRWSPQPFGLAQGRLVGGTAQRTRTSSGLRYAMYGNSQRPNLQAGEKPSDEALAPATSVPDPDQLPLQRFDSSFQAKSLFTSRESPYRQGYSQPFGKLRTPPSQGFLHLNAYPIFTTGPSPLALDVGGVITTNTTWTLADSPYTVTSDVTVQDGVTLTIEAGVTVIFEAARELDVDGNLVAVGTAADPITFTAAVSDTSGYWDHIQIGGGSVLTDSDNSRLSYVTIEGGGRGSGSNLRIYYSAPTMDHLTIRNSGGGGLYGSYAGPFTLDTAIVEDIGGDGIYLTGGDGGQVLSNLTVQNNGGDGLDLGFVSGQTVMSATIQGNGAHGLHVRNGDNLSVTNATIAGNDGYGIYANNFGDTFTLRDSAVTTNGVAARLPANALLENVDWTGNTRNEIEWRGGTISSDRSWLVLPSGVDTYRIVNDVTAADGVTLTVGAGVTVIFEAARELDVHGNLVAVGTAADPITFTAAVSDTSGYWDHIQIGGGSVLTDSDNSRLSYVTIEGGGRGSGSNLRIYYSAPTMDHLTIRNSGGGGLRGSSAGPFTLDTATIEDSGGDGIYLAGGDGGQVLTNVTVQGHSGDGLYISHKGPITVTGATFANNGGYGIDVLDGLNDLTLRDSAITGNGVAARLSADTLLENNTWSGNTRNEIEWLWGTITGDRAWTQRTGGLDTYRIFGHVTAADGVTLTVGAGVTVIFEHSRELDVHGNLVAVGTATDPITFTAAVSDTSGYWNHIHIGGGSVYTDSDNSRLSYVTIEGGGRGSGSNLYISYSAPTMDHLTIRNSGGGGLYVSSAGPFTLDTATIEDSGGDGIYLGGGDGGQVLTNVTVQGHSGDGLYISHRGSITVTNATLAGNGGYGIYVSNSYNDLTLRDSTVTGNSVAARLPLNALLENNLWLSNIRNEIEWLGGTIASDRSWLAPPSGIDTYHLTGNVTAPDGVTLTIGAGVDVLLARNADLLVNGVLVAIGTITAPITFMPASAGWVWGHVRIGGGSVLTDSDGSRLSFVTVTGGGSGTPSSNLYVDRSAPMLDHLTIRDSIGHGLYVHDSDGLEVIVSNFINNADHGLYNNTPSQVVTATYNYWGAASGPYHPDLNPEGAGQQVSDGVVFDPWLREQMAELGVVNLTATDYTTLSYDPETSTYTRLYPDGTIVHFDADGFHDYTLDRIGNKTAYMYHADGSLATMQMTPAGESTPRWTWTFSYTNGRLSAITDPAGRVTAFTVNDHGDLTQVAFPDGATRAFAYDANGLMTQHTDENGEVTTYAYDDYGRIRSVAYPQRAVYDPSTGQVELTQEIKEFTPSETAYPLINDSPVGDPDNPAPPVPLSADLVAGVSYGRGGRSGHLNRWGNWLDETDGIGRTTTYERDDRNNLTRRTYPDGSCVEYTYDDMGNVLSESRMGAAQCALDPADRDLAQVQTWTYTYESRFNQVKTETDPLSNTTTYVYDYEEGMGEAGNRIRIEYPPVPDENGVVVTPTVHYTYNSWGLLDTETDERGTITKYIYTQGTPDEASDGANPLFAPGVTPVPGLLTQVIRDYGDASHLNVTTTYKDFDASGNPMTVLGPGWVDGGAVRSACSTCGTSGGGGALAEGTVTRYTYDAWGRVLTEENALGIVTKYEYASAALSTGDGRSNLVRKIEDYTPDGTTGRNVVTTYTYDPHDQLLSQRTAADGVVQETVNTYDINRNLATWTDGNGNTTVYTYDDADQLVAETDPLGHTTTYAYTLKGERTTITQPDGDTTRTTYDPFGRRGQEIVDEGGMNLTTIFTYELNGNLLTETDANGTVTCYTYDALNRLTSETPDCGGLNLTTTYAYDVGGNRVRTTDERGVVALNIHDALGRLISARRDAEGLNLETIYAYDEAGNLVSTTDERDTVITYEYDALNHMTAMHEDAAGLDLTTRTTYDRLGNEHTVTDPKDVVRLTEYNAFGQLVWSVEDYGGLDAETRYTYDNNLNLIAITDDNGNTTCYAYNGRNQRTQILYADGSTVDYGYHPDGTLAWRTDQAGDRVDFVYDGANRLLSKNYPDGSSQTFTYDAVGRQTSAGQTMSGHTSQLSFAYNGLGGVTSNAQAVDGLSWTTTYAYDYAGGSTTVTYPSGVQIVGTLDALRRLSQVQRDGALVTSYTYDDGAGTVTLAHANGVTTLSETDLLRRVTRVSSAVADYRYGYDPASNRTYMQRWHESGHPADVYQYDDLYQLTQVWYGADATEPGAVTSYDQLQWYDLDTLGNRLEVQNDSVSEIYLPNDGIRLTDPMNRYEQVDSRSFSYDAKGNLLHDGVYTYTYDYENRQTGMSGPADMAEYVYDALGRRVAKVVDGVTTYYVYNIRYQVIEERDAGDQLLARYTYGAGIDEPLTMERGGATFTYHRDALGSITEMTDGTGALVERYTYDVYGTPRIFDGAGTPLSASGIGNLYLFTGRRYDPESRNYYYRARMYAPSLGRFMQTDPLEYLDGMNLYEYASSRPTLTTDPAGTTSGPWEMCFRSRKVLFAWRCKACFTWYFDEEACTIELQSGPRYEGLCFAPPVSISASGTWLEKTSKSKPCGELDVCGESFIGWQKVLGWTFRVQFFAHIGFREYGYSIGKPLVTLDQLLGLTCPCKK